MAAKLRLGRTMLAFLVSLGAGTMAVGQNAPNGRQVQLGSVAGLDGRPWEGATVTLHSAPPSRTFDLGTPDTVEVTAGARGRFRAELLPGRAYAAKARLGSGADLRQTAVASNIVAGQPLHLIEAKEQPASVRIVFIGLEAWRKSAAAPLSVETLDDLGRKQAADLGDQDTLTLPPLGETATLVLRTGTGPAFRRHLALVPSQRARNHEALLKQLAELPKESVPVPGLPDLAKEAPPGPDVERIVLGPPLRVRVVVADAKSKKPVAGARVARQENWNDPLQAAGTTNAEGVGEVVFERPVDAWCRRRDPGQMVFFVTAAGYARTAVGWSPHDQMGMKPLKDEDIRDGQAPELSASLISGFKVTGQIKTTAGVAARDIKLLARVPVCFQVGGGGYTTWNTQEAIEVADDGTWRLDGLGQYAWGLAVTAVLMPPHLEAVFGSEAGPFLTHGSVEISFGRQVHQVTADITANALDLAAVRLAELQLELPDGRPAARARVNCYRLDDQHGYDDRDGIRPAVYADKRGRARLLLPGDRTVLIVEEAEHYLVQELEPPNKDKPGAAGTAKRIETMRFTLTPLAIAEGRVIDLDGKPVANATLGVRSTNWFRGGQLSNYISNLNQRLLQGRSDANGRFRLGFVPEKGIQFGIGAHKAVDGNTFQQNDSLVFVSDESVRDGEIVLPFKQDAPAAGKPADRK